MHEHVMLAVIVHPVGRQQQPFERVGQRSARVAHRIVVVRHYGMLADLRLYYAAGRMLAMTDTWPNWTKGDEFRAARDKSRSAAK